MAASIRALRRQGRLGSAGLLAGREGHRAPRPFSTSRDRSPTTDKGGPAHPGDFKAQARADLPGDQGAGRGGRRHHGQHRQDQHVSHRHPESPRPGRHPRGVPRQEAPASTLVAVAALAHPDWLIEIEAIAVRQVAPIAQSAHLPRLRRARHASAATSPRRVRAGRPGLRHPHPAPRRPHASPSAWTTASRRRRSRRRSSRACSRPASTSSTSASTTPMLYFATAHWGLDGGANITGSHNPVDYNGVKMVHPGAAPLSEDEIQGLSPTHRARRLRARPGHA